MSSAADPPGYIKICGLTRLGQVGALVESGADAIGINLIPSSPRAVTPDLAAQLVQAVREHAQRGQRQVECVGLVAAPDLAREAAHDPAILGVEVQAIQAALGFDRVQLYSPQPARLFAALGRPAWAFFAARIGSAADAERCADWPGQPLVVDARVSGGLGGSGQLLDWQLVRSLSARRALMLAGGLTPDNVAHAICALRPWGVDVASGVEAGQPGVKDIGRCAAFVRAARAAFAGRTRC